MATPESERRASPPENTSNCRSTCRISQWPVCELGVAEPKQRFEITEDIWRNSPSAGLMWVRRGALNGIFSDLELLRRQICVTCAAGTS
jgi:hypothetical protein